MIPFDLAFLFVGVAFALALVPGPDNIFVLTQSALHGRIAGLIVTMGLASGLIFHTTAVALGVAVIFQTSQYAFSALKYAGAVYLLYLAWKSFRASSGQFSGNKTPAETAPKLFLRGLIIISPTRRLQYFSSRFSRNLSTPRMDRSSGNSISSAG